MSHETFQIRRFYHRYFFFASRQKCRRTHVAGRVLPRPNEQAHVRLRVIRGNDAQTRHPRGGTAVARRDFPEHVRGIIGVQPSHGRIRGSTTGFQGECFFFFFYNSVGGKKVRSGEEKVLSEYQFCFGGE